MYKKYKTCKKQTINPMEFVTSQTMLKKKVRIIYVIKYNTCDSSKIIHFDLYNSEVN